MSFFIIVLTSNAHCFYLMSAVKNRQQSLAYVSHSKWVPLIACESVFRDAGRFIPFIVYSVLLFKIISDLTILTDNTAEAGLESVGRSLQLILILHLGLDVS